MEESVLVKNRIKELKYVVILLSLLGDMLPCVPSKPGEPGPKGVIGDQGNYSNTMPVFNIILYKLHLHLIHILDCQMCVFIPACFTINL